MSQPLGPNTKRFLLLLSTSSTMSGFPHRGVFRICKMHLRKQNNKRNILNLLSNKCHPHMKSSSPSYVTIYSSTDGSGSSERVVSIVNWKQNPPEFAKKPKKSLFRVTQECVYAKIASKCHRYICHRVAGFNSGHKRVVKSRLDCPLLE